MKLLMLAFVFVIQLYGQAQQAVQMGEAPTPVAASLAVSQIGDSFCSGGASGSTTSIGTTATTGNNIHVLIAYQGSDPTVIDNYGNTYTMETLPGGGSPPLVASFYKNNAVGGAGHTVTVTGTFAANCVVLSTGLSGSPFDKQNSNPSFTGSTIQTGSVAPAGVPSLFLIVLSLGSGSFTTSNDSTFILGATALFSSGVNYGVQVLYKLSSSTENPVLTMSQLGIQSTQISVFK